MKVAVLGWGSLTWAAGTLRIDGDWQTNGPMLPIEFARVSSDGRLTLVIHTGSADVCTLWAKSSFDTLEAAVADLAERERTSTRNVGGVRARDTGVRPSDGHTFAIREWTERMGHDATIWTALASNFSSMTGREFTEDSVVAYLGGLRGKSRLKAEEYVRRTPKQVSTRMRARIERDLGWTEAA